MCQDSSNTDNRPGIKLTMSGGHSSVFRPPNEVPENPLVELVFGKSGRTAKIVNDIINQKNDAYHKAKTIFPNGLPEVIKTVVVFIGQDEMDHWKDTMINKHLFDELNVHFTCTFDPLLADLLKASGVLGSNVSVWAYDKSFIRLLIEKIDEINKVLIEEHNAELVLDHRFYDYAYGEVINKYLRYSVFAVNA